jgi:hypothetical protein
MASAQPFPIPPKASQKNPVSPSVRRKSNSGDGDYSVNSKGSRKRKPKTQLNSFPIENKIETRLETRLKNRMETRLENPQTQVKKQDQKIHRKTTFNNQSSQVKSPNHNPSKIERLPTVKRPIWLQALISLHFISSFSTFILISGALGVYGWSVYTQQSWGRAYRYLETLQRHERQLTTTNETIKNDLAQQAEKPEMGLMNPNPDTTIFLKPSSDQLKPMDPSLSEGENTLDSPSNPDHIPLGY